MIYIEKSAKVETNVQGLEQNFKIAMNSKTFRLLSDTLYSDKIKAIIRELSCNAYDAHVEANNLKETFDVKLPTIIDQEFSIRDYGVGLSEEKLTSLYLTYGESTKDDPNNEISNQLVGCFGIGSKSPFAYVDMFNVGSYYNGELKVYTVFLDNGIPKCLKIHTSKTEEKNGLRISFAVQEKDIEQFKQKAIEVFEWFQIKPKINIELNYSKKEFYIDNKDYSFSIGNVQRGFYAIQGNILYPIDSSFVSRKDITSGAIYLKFDIGEFSFAPSREALSYDEKTIKNIQDKLDNVEKDILDTIYEDISSSKTKIEFHRKYRTLYHGTSFNINYMQTKGLYNFNNEQLKHYDIMYNSFLNDISNYKIFLYDEKEKIYRSVRVTKYMKQNKSSYLLYEKYNIIYNDLNITDNNIIKKIATFFKDKKDFLLIEEPLETIEKVYDKNEYLVLSKLFNKEDLLTIKSNTKNRINKIDGFSYYNEDFNLNKTFNDKKDYLVIYYSSKKAGYIDFTLENIFYSIHSNSARNLATTFVPEDKNLIFVHTRDKHKIENLKNIQCFTNYIKTDGRKHFYKKNKKDIDNILIKVFLNGNQYLNNFFKFNLDSLIEISKDFEFFNNYYKNNEKINIGEISCTKSILANILLEAYTNKDSKIVQIMEKVPLLETINSSTYKIEDLNKKMLDYLKLVFKN